MPAQHLVPVVPLSEDACAPYGRMLGVPFQPGGAAPGFSNPSTDFWRAHVFSPGQDGQTEVLWVNYRGRGPVNMLEVHYLTEQAIVPLTGAIVHVVANSQADGSPDLASVRAFRIPPGQGICMNPGCWHATRVAGGEATCLMLTRRSTTLDLIAHMRDHAPATESALRPVAEFALDL